MKKKLWIGISTAILAAACLCIFLFAGIGGTYYYCQIDNSRFKESKPGGGVVNFKGSLEYAYTLPCYNEKGKEKEITFGTSRELKEGAFIRLTTVPIRGVTTWSEVQYGELPDAVQEKYERPE